MTAGVFASLVGAGAAVAAALVLLYEAWALSRGATPITGYVRGGIARWPGVAFVVAIAAGLLLGHFFWNR